MNIGNGGTNHPSINETNMLIKLDPYLVKKKKCPFGQTYLETWNEFLGKHDEGHQEPRRVGSIACSKCQYFDMEYAMAQKEKPTTIKCDFK